MHSNLNLTEITEVTHNKFASVLASDCNYIGELLEDESGNLYYYLATTMDLMNESFIEEFVPEPKNPFTVGDFLTALNDEVYIHTNSKQLVQVVEVVNDKEIKVNLIYPSTNKVYTVYAEDFKKVTPKW